MKNPLTYLPPKAQVLLKKIFPIFAPLVIFSGALVLAEPACVRCDATDSCSVAPQDRGKRKNSYADRPSSTQGFYTAILADADIPESFTPTAELFVQLDEKAKKEGAYKSCKIVEGEPDEQTLFNILMIGNGILDWTDYICDVVNFREAGLEHSTLSLTTLSNRWFYNHPPAHKDTFIKVKVEGMMYLPNRCTETQMIDEKLALIRITPQDKRQLVIIKQVKIYPYKPE